MSGVSVEFSGLSSTTPATATIGSSITNFIREGVALSIAQIKAEHTIRLSKSLIYETTGFKLESLPKLVVLNESASTCAQYYGEKLIVYGRNRLNDKIINHELFHYAQEKLRKSMRDSEPEVDFLRAFGLGIEIVLGEHGNPTQQSLARSSLLWNGTNEAGAYLFGFFSTHLSSEDNTQSAREILTDFERHMGVNLRSVSDSVLNFIFTPGSNLAEYTYLGNGRYHVTKDVVAMVIAGIILEQNNLDARKSSRDLLDFPERTLSRIKALGVEGAKASLERISILLNEY